MFIICIGKKSSNGKSILLTVELILSVILTVCVCLVSCSDKPYNKNIKPDDIREETEQKKPEVSEEDYLILVNRDHPLPSYYVPADLCETEYTRKDGREMQKIRKQVSVSLSAMIEQMKSEGIFDENLSVTSGYRSFDYQKYLFDLYVDNRVKSGMTYDDAYKDTLRTTALPGCSEHQSGLCFDFHNKESANVSFANTEQYRWLKENAHKFGFIIRYPSGKESITGISFEPWHLRYVGINHATKMYSDNLTLEEYVSATDKKTS